MPQHFKLLISENFHLMGHFLQCVNNPVFSVFQRNVGKQVRNPSRRPRVNTYKKGDPQNFRFLFCCFFFSWFWKQHFICFHLKWICDSSFWNLKKNVQLRNVIDVDSLKIPWPLLNSVLVCLAKSVFLRSCVYFKLL